MGRSLPCVARKLVSMETPYAPLCTGHDLTGCTSTELTLPLRCCVQKMVDPPPPQKQLSSFTDKGGVTAGARITHENDDLYGVKGLSKRRTDPWKNRETQQGLVSHIGQAHTQKKKNELVGRVQKLMVIKLSSFVCHALARTAHHDSSFAVSQASTNMREVLNDGEQRARPISAMRAEMSKGLEQPTNETLSSEQRVVRQQIFAAVSAAKSFHAHFMFAAILYTP